MRLGNQTVTFVAVTLGTEGRFEAPPIRTRVDVTGCLFRPLLGSEELTETDVITRPWECVAPPVTAALNADATGELEYNGQTWLITSVEPHPDFLRPVHHVTVTATQKSA